MLFPLVLVSVAANGYWNPAVISGALGVIALFWATVWAVLQAGSAIRRRYQPADRKGP